MKPEYFSSSAGQTKKIAEKFAGEILKILKKKPKKKALVIGLTGELGGGKTTFLQGFARGLGIKEKILSPTFIIYRKSQIPTKELSSLGKRNLVPLTDFYHFDCYRIQKPKELLALGFREIISNPQNIVAIEWADKIKKIMPKTAVWLNFEFINEKTRKITLGV